MSLDGPEADAYLAAMRPFFAAYAALDALPDDLPAPKYPREAVHRPVGDDNRWNAWYVKARVRGADSGPLSGKTVALKDNVMLAGVPLLNGASILDGYVPEIDATIVTRILDAGGEIVGKAHCESFCLSGGSHTNASGPVHNPHKMGYSAGGSSSGSAALLVAGEVDMAIGGDQGGSIRIPASYCGVVGLKPTHGLVPYTGIMPIEIFVDHTGPMTTNVADNALMLETLAGPDGYDPRQYNVETHAYTEALGGGAKGLRIAVVSEGFGHENSEADVDACVHKAADQFARLGADVKDVSIPMHQMGSAIWLPIGVNGLTQTMMCGDGYGCSRSDLYVTSLMDYHRGWRTRADEMSETTKLFTLLGTYIEQQHGFRYYGKAMNINRRLTAAYNAVLADCDLLLMPTLPMKATPIPGPDASREEYVQRALEMIANTAPFDITHHPAMSLPCGLRDGLPVGMMLIGKHWDEPAIYRAAHAFEQSEDWREM